MDPTRPQRESSTRQAAAELVARGYAVCRIAPDEKRPTYPRWATRSVHADEVAPGEGIGLVCGPISGPAGRALVCADLDAGQAVRLADEYLPPTSMVEGRAGKPRSHRWYLVPLASIPDEERSHAPQSAPAMARDYGHPGPRTVSFRAGGRELLRVLGTGAQAVVPPSRHPSGERRQWEGRRAGNPAEVEFRVLLRAVRRLARECGWVPAVAAVAAGRTDAALASVGPFFTYRVNRYLDELPASVSGRGGHNACFRAACVLAWGFALSEAEALAFMSRFNRRCRPGWSGRELLHKVREAAAVTDHAKPRGHLL